MLENRILELSDIEIREDNGEHHIIALVAPWHATFDTGQYVERLGRSVFDKSIKERGSKIPLMHGHDRERFPIGMAGSWSNDNNGLIADFRMASTERSAEALALAKDGYVTGFSVGFHPVRSSESKQDGRRQITRLEAKLDASDLWTVLGWTLAFSANSSCVHPCFWRNAFNFLASIFMYLLQSPTTALICLQNDRANSHGSYTTVLEKSFNTPGFW